MFCFSSVIFSFALFCFSCQSYTEVVCHSSRGKKFLSFHKKKNLEQKSEKICGRKSHEKHANWYFDDFLFHFGFPEEYKSQGFEQDTTDTKEKMARKWKKKFKII
jgi:hypothetical protein